MNRVEWDKCFIWLAAMFPQWNVTQATSVSWYDELKVFDPEQFKNAIRLLMSRKPSSFPPGVFVIKGAIKDFFKPNLYKLPERQFTDEEWELNRKKANEVVQNLTKTA